MVDQVGQFREGQTKSPVLVILTPSGLKQKYQITKTFLNRNEYESESLRLEIEEARKMIDE
jgi:hypothetical protein